jgi:hypothetical protein
MYNWNPYMYNQAQHNMVFNENYDADEDWEVERNDIQSAPNMAPMMENVPMPAIYPQAYPMATMPLHYPQAAYPMMTMPMDCTCHPPIVHDCSMFTGSEYTPPMTPSVSPYMAMENNSPIMDVTTPSSGLTYPITGTAAPFMGQMPAAPFMHGHYPLMMGPGYHPYYPYR